MTARYSVQLQYLKITTLVSYETNMCTGWQIITLLHAVSKHNILYLFFD